MRLGNGIRCIGPTSDPNEKVDGVPVIDWTSIHTIIYADKDNYAGFYATIRTWRWYDKQRDGQSGATNDQVGRWIPDCDTIVSLDPALSGGHRSADHIWQTRGAAKMFWQIISVKDASGNVPTVFPWVIIQPFGYTRNDEPMVVAVFDTGCQGTVPGGDDGGGGCCSFASADATHWSPADGIVSYAADDQLTCTGWPFVVDNGNCSTLSLLVVDENSVVTEYINGVNGVSLTANSNTVTISGVTPFANTDLAYYLYVVYQEKAYNDISDSLRTEEIEPLNTKYTMPEYILNLTYVTSDLSGYAPSENGIIIDDYKDIDFQIHLIGGTKINETPEDCTVTMKFQGCNDLDDGSGNLVWVDLASGYSLSNDTTQDSWSATGDIPLDDLVDFDNYIPRRIRVYYEWDKTPTQDAGQAIITTRRKAL